MREYKLGYIFDENEAKEIAAQIEELYHNKKLHLKLSNNVRKAFKTTFNWEKMEQRLLAAYNSMIKVGI